MTGELYMSISGLVTYCSNKKSQMSGIAYFNECWSALVNRWMIHLYRSPHRQHIWNNTMKQAISGTNVLFKNANHMTMTTSGQIMPWSDCLKTKGNVKIKLWDLCETLIVCILLSTFLISPHGIDYKQTWYQKIYHMDRVSWLKPLLLYILLYVFRMQ